MLFREGSQGATALAQCPSRAQIPIPSTRINATGSFGPGAISKQPHAIPPTAGTDR